jgi:hypothetical protein
VGASSPHSPPPFHPGGILATNKVPVEDDGSEFALCALTCRLNHACKGACNANFSWEKKLQRALVFASRPIAAGEEITVSYRPYETYAQRQAVLLEGWNFTCRCAACEVSEEEREKADERLKEITELIQAVKSVGA